MLLLFSDFEPLFLLNVYRIPDLVTANISPKPVSSSEIEHKPTSITTQEEVGITVIVTQLTPSRI